MARSPAGPEPNRGDPAAGPSLATGGEGQRPPSQRGARGGQALTEASLARSRPRGVEGKPAGGGQRRTRAAKLRPAEEEARGGLGSPPARCSLSATSGAPSCFAAGSPPPAKGPGEGGGGRTLDALESRAGLPPPPQSGRQLGSARLGARLGSSEPLYRSGAEGGGRELK